MIKVVILCVVSFGMVHCQLGNINFDVLLDILFDNPECNSLVNGNAFPINDPACDCEFPSELCSTDAIVTDYEPDYFENASVFCAKVPPPCQRLLEDLEPEVTTPQPTTRTTASPITTTQARQTTTAKTGAADAKDDEARDWHSKCCEWAQAGGCDSDPVLTRTVCQKSCGTKWCSAETALQCQVKLNLDHCPQNAAVGNSNAVSPKNKYATAGSAPKAKVAPSGYHRVKRQSYDGGLFGDLRLDYELPYTPPKSAETNYEPPSIDYKPPPPPDTYKPPVHDYLPPSPSTIPPYVPPNFSKSEPPYVPPPPPNYEPPLTIDTYEPPAELSSYSKYIGHAGIGPPPNSPPPYVFEAPPPDIYEENTLIIDRPPIFVQNNTIPHAGPPPYNSRGSNNRIVSFDNPANSVSFVPVQEPYQKRRRLPSLAQIRILCTDLLPHCADWAAHDGCLRSPRTIFACPKSCRAC